MNSTVHRPEGERLQKVLAAAGVGSRRDCEELILSGRIDVEGVIVDELGVRVDPNEQAIRCDGIKLNIARQSYWILNKPVGVVCTNNDPSGRTKVVDMIPSDQRLFTVGRLDRTSSGLILVTNDGEFANKLAHPRYRVDKTYLVTVAGKPAFKELSVLTEGVRLSEGVAKVESVKIKRRRGMSTDLEIVLREGKNREIRRILAKLGYKVLTLHRIAISSIRLADLPIGECRRLTSQELKRLTALTGGKKTAGKARAPKKARPAKPNRRSASADAGDRSSAKPAKSSAKPAKRAKRESLPEAQTLGHVLGGDDGDIPGGEPVASPTKAPRKSRNSTRPAAGKRSTGKKRVSGKTSSGRRTTKPTKTKTTRKATRKKRK